MNKLFFALFALLLSFFTQAEDSNNFPGVENLMSAEELRETGLDKLGPDEREALNKWLIRYTAWQAPEIRRTSKEVIEAEKAFELTATIRQPFTGWTGKTNFYFENGEIWQQRSGGKYYYSGEQTGATISRNFLGFYTMELKATGKKVLVKKIR